MNKKTYKTNDDYILEVLEDEEERLLYELGGMLSEEEKYLFYRYSCVRDKIENIKSKKIV